MRLIVAISRFIADRVTEGKSGGAVKRGLVLTLHVPRSLCSLTIGIPFVSGADLVLFAPNGIVG